MVTRLPPIPPNKLTVQQRLLYDDMKADIAVSYQHVQVERNDGALVGPFNPRLHEPDIGRTIWQLNRVLSAPSSIPERPREVATLVVGGHFGAVYEIKSHRFYAMRAGLSASAVDAIIAGHKLEGLTEPEGCAYDVAAALCMSDVVADPLYADTIRLCGQRITSELVYLCGPYALTCMTRNTFDVAGPEYT